MRAISLVKRIEFEFHGNIVRNAITLGDVDNDGCNELIVGNHIGELAVFKGEEKVQSISKLSFISCVAVGDVLNESRNVLVIITADGWCYLYAASEKLSETLPSKDVDEVDGQMYSTSTYGSSETLPSSDTPSNPKQTKKSEQVKSLLVCIHKQRIPANSKCILLGDVDGDGMIEMVLGLTDRVVRSYRWESNPHKPIINFTDSSILYEPSDKLLGKFMALNKWECANQIGSITLHHMSDGKIFLLVAQPGGTFMRIRCQSEDSVSQVSTDASGQTASSRESIPGSVDYQRLGISRMRNQNISTEILGDLEFSRDGSKGRPYALATLDGTIMLVEDEVILWAIAVDHQIFALTKLDITGNGCDDIVVCSWDGQTYILDQDKNSVRFHLKEAVQAFECGYYNITPNMPDVTSLVYVTFKNMIIIYYDIPLKDLTCKKFDPELSKLKELFRAKGKSEDDTELLMKMEKKTKKELVEYLLYKVKL